MSERSVPDMVGGYRTDVRLMRSWIGYETLMRFKREWADLKRLVVRCT